MADTLTTDGHFDQPAKRQAAMARGSAWAGGWLALVCLAAAAAPASGQSYVQPPCAAEATPAFEDQLQSIWYRRFWTGECTGLSFLRCRSGSPYWNQVVHTLMDRATPADRAQVATRACRLGRQIGLEWTRPSAERRINTKDLQAFDATLEKAPDVLTAIATVEASIRGRTGS